MSFMPINAVSSIYCRCQLSPTKRRAAAGEGSLFCSWVCLYSVVTSLKSREQLLCIVSRSLKRTAREGSKKTTSSFATYKNLAKNLSLRGQLGERVYMHGSRGIDV